MNPALFLVLVSLVLLILRGYQPWVKPIDGALVRRWRVPLAAKVRLQRANVYAIAALLILGGLGGWLPGGAQLLVVLSVVAVLLAPLQYTLTETGIALGRTSPRPWRDFTGCDRRGDRVVLDPAEGVAGMTIWLPRPPEDRLAVNDLRRLVRGAPRGTATDQLLDPQEQPTARSGFERRAAKRAV
jgi:hypothetical protein